MIMILRAFIVFGLIGIAVLIEANNKGDLTNPDKQNIRLVESERIEEYHKRNYTWPVSKFVPDTPGWRSIMQERFMQVSELDGSLKRYEGFIQTVHTAFLVPNFTEYGFGLARCPDDLITTLRTAIREGLPTAREEVDTPVINGPQRPLFVDRPDLTARVLHEMKPYAEEWSGLELTAYRAYGFRLYRNESQLTMHVDKMQTHVISFILHIDSSDDAEPWPIFIEDFHGNTHEVILTPGDVLFYESTKCFHGRPRRLNGSWYSSLFVHYYPSNGWYNLNHELEAHYAVPPNWNTDPPLERKHTRLEMVGTSMRHPECPDNWCYTQNSVKWSGPGEPGYWITPTQRKIPFHPKIQHDEL